MAGGHGRCDGANLYGTAVQLQCDGGWAGQHFAARGVFVELCGWTCERLYGQTAGTVERRDLRA